MGQIKWQIFSVGNTKLDADEEHKPPLTNK